MKKPSLIACTLALALTTACADDPPPRVEPEPEPAPKPAAPAAPVEPEPEPTPDEVPIAEDFTEQAKAEISPRNLRAQLDALEREIARDAL